MLDDAEISSLVKPPDGVWMWVSYDRQAQPLHGICGNEVLLAPILDNELYRGALYPHLGVEEMFLLLWSFRFLLLDLRSGNNGIGLHSIVCFYLSFPLSGSDSE